MCDLQHQTWNSSLQLLKVQRPRIKTYRNLNSKKKRKKELNGQFINGLTLEAISIQQFLAFLVHFDSTISTAHALPGNAPQQALTLAAVGGRSGRPHLEVMRSGAGDGVNQGL